MHTTNVASATTLVVLDPGLSNSSGHHFSTAELLLKTLAKNKHPIDVKIMGGSGNWKHKLQNIYSHTALNEHFQSNFYQYHNGMVSLTELTPYLTALSCEYKAAMTHQLISGAHSTVFFCHTLDWDHFLALSIAIHQLQQATPGLVINCLACLMFSPGRDSQHKITDNKKYILAKIALRTSAHLTGLSIFASHYELKQAIDNLQLPQPKEITIHPCFITEWYKTTTQTAPASTPTSDLNVLLYAGDAKETKGFHLLPALLKTHLSGLRQNVRLIIQFTCAQKISPRLQNAIQELNTMAVTEKRIVIYNQYFSDQQLAELLNHSDIFLFNYSPHHYANMSSGFLWHLAWHKVPMFTFDNSWITREAQRLAVEAHIIQQQNFCAFINALTPKISLQHNKKLPANEYQTYYDALFSPPLDWLYRECKKAQ